VNDVLEGAGRRAWQLLKRAASSYVVVLALGVIVGLQVAPAAWSVAVDSGTEGTVAVVPLEGSINGAQAAAVTAQLQRARQSPDVEAVVLQVNSPGGGAAASETLFMQIKRTSEQLPVVTSVGSLAASGGYYALAPTDYVYTKPAALVGSVGTLASLPGEIEPIGDIVTTGPEKLRSGDTRDWYYNIKAVQAAFLNAVVENRDLNVTPEVVSQAKLYPGSVAVRMGLADETGGTETAVRRAAKMAGLGSYDVEVFQPTGSTQFLTRTAYIASDAPNKTMISPTYYTGPPGQEPAVPRLLMLPGSVFGAAIDRSTNETVSAGNVTATAEVNNATVAG
jgi:protease-4